MADQRLIAGLEQLDQHAVSERICDATERVDRADRGHVVAEVDLPTQSTSVDRRLCRSHRRCGERLGVAERSRESGRGLQAAKSGSN
jgi:hypothetical protein